ncbi:FMN-binding protein [uncultured Amnibacterium sp.]|uniref:FMN-binding protein n=1 Tax=uncultured Amnibacterium sp. TaxID=1631851 RepID=UPI0035C9DEC7
MRRAPIVVSATLIGAAGVLLFKPLPASSIEGSETGSGSAAGSGDSSPASLGPSGSSAPQSSASSAAGSTTVTGAVETDRYGNTQIRATIKNGKITDVTVLEYNNGDPRSAQISQAAMPALRSEVLSNQTAAVDAVSGATYTSNAYEASLQSALDKAGFVASDGSKANTDLASADANLRGH